MAFEFARMDVVFQNALRADALKKRGDGGLGDLDQRRARLHADLSDLCLVEVPGPAQQRQEPARLGPPLLSDRQLEPDRGTEGRTVGARALRRRGIQFFRGRKAGPVEPQAGGGDLLGAVLRQQFCGKGSL